MHIGHQVTNYITNTEVLTEPRYSAYTYFSSSIICIGPIMFISCQTEGSQNIFCMGNWLQAQEYKDDFSFNSKMSVREKWGCLIWTPWDGGGGCKWLSILEANTVKGYEKNGRKIGTCRQRKVHSTENQQHQQKASLSVVAKCVTATPM